MHGERRIDKKMMNTAALFKLMGAKSKFEQAHPGVSKFIGDIYSQGLEEGSVVEITITKPDGSKMTTNMKIQASDLEMLNELKNLR